MEKKKIIITEESIKDKFICYGHFQPSNPRCDAYMCPWCADSSCPDRTMVEHLKLEFERLN